MMSARPPITAARWPGTCYGTWSMHPRAADLIHTLALRPHPEGGHFAEVFKSPHLVQRLEGDGARAALTTIYFLLAEGERSRWHQVAADEVWHYYEGDPLELVWEEQVELRRVQIGPVAKIGRASCR